MTLGSTVGSQRIAVIAGIGHFGNLAHGRQGEGGISCLVRLPSPWLWHQRYSMN
jgi:hypothetical protein